MRIKDFFSTKEPVRNKGTWRDLDGLPKEVVSDDELDGMREKILSSIREIQNEAIAESSVPQKAKPQSLFYCHKYIDAEFSKEFDIESYYGRKQNIIDKNYAEGLGELKKEVTGYLELLAEVRQIENRMRRKLRELDPETQIDFIDADESKKSIEVVKTVDGLPHDINWQIIEEKK